MKQKSEVLVELKPFEQSVNVAPEWPSRVTRVTLFHLDGSTSEIKLTAPNYGRWSEIQELAYLPLSNYVDSLTARFIKIHSYYISLGSIDCNGKEHYSIHYPVTEIPLKKVYHNGKWVYPQ